MEKLKCGKDYSEWLKKFSQINIEKREDQSMSLVIAKAQRFHTVSSVRVTQIIANYQDFFVLYLWLCIQKLPLIMLS